MDNNTTNSIVKVDPSAKDITINGIGGMVDLPQDVYNAIVRNDFSNAPDAMKAAAIRAICGAIGVSPIPPPFNFIKGKLDPKAELYEMLGHKWGLSVKITEKFYDERTQNYFIYGTCTGKDGRVSENMGGQFIPKTATGVDYLNAIKKAHTNFNKRIIKAHVGLSIPGWDDTGALDEVAESGVDRSDTMKAFHAIAGALKKFPGTTAEAKELRHAYYAEVLGREVEDGADITTKEWELLLNTIQAEAAEVARAVVPDTVEQQVIDAEYQVPPTEQVVAEIAEAVVTMDDDEPFPFPEQAGSPTPVEDDTLTYGVYETMVSEAAELGIKMHIRAHREKWAMLAKLEGEPGWIESGHWREIKDKGTTTTKLAAVIAEMKSKAVKA